MTAPPTAPIVRRLAFLLLLVGAVVLVVSLARMSNVHVTPKTLTASFEREIGLGVVADPCRRGRAGWTCQASDGSDGTATYRLSVDGGCWKGTRIGRTGSVRALPGDLDGCVLRHDD